MQKIVPHLWFDTQAKAAAEFYCSVFPNSRILMSSVLKNTPSGDCDILSFDVNGQEFMAISAGPLFKFNQSISFMVNFDPSHTGDATGQLQAVWNKLAEGGTVMMPLQEYPYSKQYGWVQDKYGVGWQLMLTDPAGNPRPFIIPSLMFSGAAVNQAEAAITFYESVFKDSKPGTLARYPQATGPAKQGSIMFADYQLEGQWLAAMDSGVDQDFSFNEAISLLINCDTQADIDYYWGKLSADPRAEQCGWLKDKFGVWWQVAPSTMNKFLGEGTPDQIARTTKAFLKMKKINLAELEAARRGA